MILLYFRASPTPNQSNLQSNDSNFGYFGHFCSMNPIFQSPQDIIPLRTIRATSSSATAPPSSAAPVAPPAAAPRGAM